MKVCVETSQVNGNPLLTHGTKYYQIGLLFSGSVGISIRTNKTTKQQDH